MQLIGILGGTFDPIHNGHLHAAQQLVKLLQFEQIRFVPSFKPVHRTHPFATANDRLAMVKLAVAAQPVCIADTREIQRQGISYMYDTLHSLREEFPDASLCLILGVDAFQYFEQWSRWQEIISLAHLVVTNRLLYQLMPSPVLTKFMQQHLVHNTAQLKNVVAGNILFVDIDPLPISATQIRTLIAENKDISGLVPLAVQEYIQRQRLYCSAG